MDKKIDDIGRRKLLALIGVGVAGFSSSTYRSPTKINSNQIESANETNPEAVDASETDQQIGIDIIDHGASEGEDSVAQALANVRALRSAALEAGAGGTIYVPEGEFYFGHSEDTFQCRFGDELPPGISFLGEGPFKSKLTLTENVDSGSSYRGLLYSDGDENNTTKEHGEVNFENICFDGNYENLDMNDSQTIWGIVVRSDGSFNLNNVCVQGWWAAGTRFTGPSVHIKDSRFQENAIGVAQTNESPTSGHHVVARPPAKNSVLIEDSEFIRCSGSVVNRTFGDGDITLRRLWVRGVGNSLMKLSRTDGTTWVENTNFKGATEWMVRNLPETSDLDGRWFIHRIAGAEYHPTVVLTNVLITSVPWETILCYQDTDLYLKGDHIAIRDAATDEEGSTVIRGDSGITFDIDDISIHDTEAPLFDAPGSTGRIRELNWPGNGELGEIGELDIKELSNNEPLQPNVVRQYEVGPNATVTPMIGGRF